MANGVDITGPQLPPPDHIIARHKAIATRAMQEATVLTERTWKQRAVVSRRTGTYERSITRRVQPQGNQIVGEIGTNLFYAGLLERGTGLYGPRHRLIVPVKAKALRWGAGGKQTFDPQTGGYTGFVPGRGFRLSGQQRAGAAGAKATFIFRKSVKGIKPRRYAHDAALQAQPGAVSIFQRAGLEMAQVVLGGGGTV